MWSRSGRRGSRFGSLASCATARYDVINTEPQLLSGLVVWLAALRRVPVRIVTIHNSIGDPGQTARSRIVRTILSNRLFVWAMRSLITRHATRVIAVSRSALDSVLPGRWQSACDASCVVYNGTDPAPFQQPAGVPEACAESSDGRRRAGSW